MKKITAALILFFFTVFLFAFSTVSSAANSPVASKSNEVKTQACGAHEENLKTRMGNLLKLTNNIFRVFDSITDRVKEFYQNKVVTEGKSVANYNFLLSTIQTKKDAVKISIDKATADSQSFSCNSESPKLALINFRKDMQTVKNSLKEYRTSIKNLVVAVHSVSAQIDKSKLSTTPKPTKINSKNK